MGSTSAEELNRKMVKFFPELASGYARYPMKRTKWLDPKEKGMRGEPCFIKADKAEAEIKIDYVFGPAKYGRGYYNLLTKESYQIFHGRTMSEVPVSSCACTKAARKELDEWDDVKRIIYARSVATIPDDAVAYQDSILEARATANGYSMGMQTQLLTNHTVNVVNAGF